MDGPIGQRYGPWAVIAGASDGVGAEFARQAAAAGIHCLLVARRVDALDRLAAELRQSFGVEALCAVIDLALPGATERMLAAAGERQIGLFVFNAGSDTFGTRLLDTPAGDWATLVSRNVSTLLASVHAFATRMVAVGRGGLVLVGSDAAFGGSARLAVYSATKAFALVLGESLWAELAPKGVDVLNLVIGATDTPKLRAVLQKNGIALTGIAMAQPRELVREAFAHLGQGPDWVLGSSEESVNPLTSPAVRRQRVLEISRFLDLFYGKET